MKGDKHGIYQTYADFMLSWSETLSRMLRYVGETAVKRRGRVVVISLALVFATCAGFKDFYIESDAGRLWLPEVNGQSSAHFLEAPLTIILELQASDARLDEQVYEASFIKNGVDGRFFSMPACQYRSLQVHSSLSDRFVCVFS